jgi:hypothetical protein
MTGTTESLVHHYKGAMPCRRLIMYVYRKFLVVRTRLLVDDNVVARESGLENLLLNHQHLLKIYITAEFQF